MTDVANADWGPPNEEPRLGVIPAFRTESLQDPFVVWDSRSWDGESDVLENLGTGGSKFDLYFVHPDTGFESNIFKTQSMSFANTLNWDNSFATYPRYPVPKPQSWDDWGGPICNGAFTVMFAISPHFTFRRDSPNGEYAYIEADLISNFDTIDRGFNLAMNLIGDNDDSSAGPDFPPGYAPSDIFFEWYTGRSYIQWFAQAPVPSSESSNGAAPQPWIAGKLVTFTVDPWLGRVYIWIDQELVKFFDLWGDTGPSEILSETNENFIDFDENCLNFENFSSKDTGELFFYFGEHRGSPFYYPGRAWRNIVGAAFFRGMPGPEDREYWRDYFLAGNEYQIGQFDRTLSVSRDSLSTTSAHSFEWTVPAEDPPVTAVKINAGQAGSSFVYVNDRNNFSIPAVSGDLIRIELGGAGSIGGTTTPTPGGWPDGGPGGVNSNGGKYGGSGAGSTKIYKNGVLMIHMPGGGGNGFAASNTTTQSGGIDQGAVITFDGAPAVGVTPLENGRGATASAPGAAGSTGGSPGSGSNGGAGQSGAFTADTSGGGGGGGGYFGGGGGSVITTGTPRGAGGGSGSWFIHPSVTYETDVDQFASNTGFTRNASVLLYW